LLGYSGKLCIIGEATLIVIVNSDERHGFVPLKLEFQRSPPLLSLERMKAISSVLSGILQTGEL
jgi:hypothetical protein